MSGQQAVQLCRVLTLWDLIFYGIVIIQPTAPMPVFGVVSQVARGHVVTAVQVAMVAMLFTAISYGRMARAYPSAGSAYSYVSNALHPALGYVAGWSITLDYLMNPIICTIWCSKAVQNFLPEAPYVLLAVSFAVLFTMLNLRGIETSARFNKALTLSLCVVVALFLVYAARYIFGHQPAGVKGWLMPFYDPKSFSISALSRGSAIAVLTYIGFDSVSTLSEEVKDPGRNVLLATVLTCLITGVLASIEVYSAQLVWPDYQHYPDVDTAFVHVAARAGGRALFTLMNFALLFATIGSGFASQLAAARLMFGMGRENALPQRFFGVLDPVRRIPRNNVLLTGALILIGALTVSYAQGAEMLNFGAFIAFMGVNASAFALYCVQRNQRTWKDWLPPVAGFLVCLYIWLNLSPLAKTAGGIWLAAGVTLAIARGKLMRREPAAQESSD
ncbi:MAG: APC family permease [Acidobacteriaceae bacterium]|nr:APC family permease [Acidobacteriaceae bacterium]